MQRYWQRCSLTGFVDVARTDEILVAAAASLTDVLKELSAAYQSKSKNIVNFNFGPSSTLARQIEEGAPADVFFSADVAQMDDLEKNGRLEPGTRKNLLSNQLVMVVPSDSKLAIASPKDLLKPEVKRIALAEPPRSRRGLYQSISGSGGLVGQDPSRRWFRYKMFARRWLLSSRATSKPGSCTKPTPRFPRK